MEPARSKEVALRICLEMTRVDSPTEPFAAVDAPGQAPPRAQVYTLQEGSSLQEFAVDWAGPLRYDLAALDRPSPEPGTVQRVGDALRRSLTRAGWPPLAHAVGEAVDDARRVMVTIRSNAGELYGLPWESLTLPQRGQPLGMTPGVTIRHEWPGTHTRPEEPTPRLEGGRILLAWSAAAGAVPAAEHAAAIRTACVAGHPHGAAGLEILAHASPARLVATLRAAVDAGEPFAVLHILCHGALVGSTHGLALDGEGEPAVADAGLLRDLLSPFAGTLRLVVLAACDGGNLGAAGNPLGSVALALHRGGFAAVLAARHPLAAAAAVVLARSLYEALLGGPDSLESAVVASRAALAVAAGGSDWATLQLYARAEDGDDTRPVVYRPFRGLLPFEARHRRFFFGRDLESDAALGALQRLIDRDHPRLLIVAGASGTGKSSLALSGIVPKLGHLRPRLPGAWEVAVVRPGSRPLEEIAVAFKRRRSWTSPLLLVVDQFEEIFTHADPAERETFARRLWSLARAQTGIHCILTIRVDFLERCGEIVLDEAGTRLDRIAYDEAHRVFVARIAQDQVRAAIEGPAAAVGLTLEPGLCARILTDVGNEPGALPLLQYTLDHLWLHRCGRTLGAELYGEFGGLVGALQTRADALIDALDDDERRHARQLLTHLVGVGEEAAVDTRRRVPLARLTPADGAAQAVFQRVLARLVDARLVVRSDDHGAPTLEIAHEALIRRWERLRGWISEDRVKLTELAKVKGWATQWQRHGTLLGARLGYASELVRRYPDEIDARMGELVRVSQRRQRWNHTLQVGGAGLGLALAAAAWTSWQSAQARELRAARAADEARTSLRAVGQELQAGQAALADAERRVGAAQAAASACEELGARLARCLELREDYMSFDACLAELHKIMEDRQWNDPGPTTSRRR